MPGEILPRHIIIGVIIFTIFIVGTVTVINEFDTGMDGDLVTGMDTDQYLSFNKSFNKFDEINESVTNLQTNIEQADESSGIFAQIFGALDALVNKAWNALKLIIQSFDFIKDIFTAMGEFLGVPGFISALIWLIVVVVFSFAIYTAIFQREI